MLLFKPEHVQPILLGQKTETRRIWKSQRVKIGSTQLAKTQMLSKDYFAKLTIVAVWQEKLGEITDDGAKREGYPNRELYLAKFAEINRVRIEDWIDKSVYVIRFTVQKGENDGKAD